MPLEELTDPYALPETAWSGDITNWLNVEFGNMYNTQKDQQCSINTDNFYQGLYAAIPTACIFTSVSLPEFDSVAHNVTMITTSRPSDSLTN